MKWLLVDEAVKFHVKFGILFVILWLNTPSQTCFYPSHTWSPLCPSLGSLSMAALSSFMASYSKTNLTLFLCHANF
jgi:hypothetical protein